MKEGPDIARIASLVGDPARANMLTALMDGGALTASELALEAGVGLPTASSHLAKLVEGGLLKLASQGRHRYFGLAGPQVAAMLESIMGVAAQAGPSGRGRGPKTPGCGKRGSATTISPASRRWRCSTASSPRKSLFATPTRSARPGGAIVHFGDRHRHRASRQCPPADVPRLPRLERAPLAPRRLAGCGDPRQDPRREMGAPSGRQPRGRIHAARAQGIRKDLPRLKVVLPSRGDPEL